MIEILLPALLAAMMIAATHVPLGLEVLKRGIIFIDLAMAQLAGVGVVIASLIWPENKIMVQICALGCALIGASVFSLTERHAKKYQEAIIGVSFVIAASLTLLLLANDPHGGETVEHLLSGQILFVTFHHLAFHAVVYAGVLISWFSGWAKKSSFIFYGLFAMAITSSVQLVGVYLVFASLILPALGAAPYKQKLPIAYMIAATGLIGGMVLSYAGDLPSGPFLVISLSLAAILAVLFKTTKRKK